MSGLVGNSTLPGAYVYLPNKDADTYNIMMKHVIEIVQKVFFNPLKFNTYMNMIIYCPIYKRLS